MSEEDALKFPPTTSIDLISDATKSSMELIAASGETKVGDMIRVCITMYDHTGHRKTTGGDILKLYMCNQSQWSTRRGTVVDHNNGTYTGEVEAAWSGQSELVARLEYTREAISAMYRMASLEIFHAVFQEGNVSETTVCHPDLHTLRKYFNYTRVCDMTYENSGMHWYCDTKAYTTVSVARRLDNIKDDEDAVVVIHIYIHLLLYHHSIFERKMRMIRTSVASLLQRNKLAQVVILGPHTFDSYAKFPDLDRDLITTTIKLKLKTSASP
ncbi:NXPE family member 3-like [Dreissena polymorpha]|uniref:NXPE family member 3-like n=1 Tax=Dreissena polymorpha TaxID=45954 RepID=UPI002264BB34|nr:NXPE family member 3-like [Dreissena polymorpha]